MGNRLSQRKSMKTSSLPASLTVSVAKKELPPLVEEILTIGSINGFKNDELDLQYQLVLLFLSFDFQLDG